ncbi:hypothetical protein CHS0354_017048 [Potamilus streckersoni]|uniref:Uncharacterized protein n=1 Tax=Potamilus streckersoni TaxID=2493646 RepID=A0AAE0SYZ1_9BIVA|nr:hypothetical protein CHS0354_017048 [Potamilus streckersoni]
MKNGNLQFGDRSYDLRPAVTGDKPSKLLNVTDNISRIYLYLDQTQLQQQDLVENKDAYDVYETHVRWKHKTPFQPFTRQVKQNFYHLPDDMSSFRNPTNMYDRGTPGEKSYG